MIKYDRDLSDDQFALFHNPKGRTYKRLPKGFKALKETPTEVVVINLPF